jgi:hypothetical protein
MLPQAAQRNLMGGGLDTLVLKDFSFRSSSIININFIVS